MIALFNAQNEVSLSVTETGDSLVNDASFDYGVWTGSQSSGTSHWNHCADWISTAGAGQVGQADSTSTSWTGFSGRVCTESLHLYCFED